MICKQEKKKRASPGIEPGTSRTLSENHASRPTGLSWLANPQNTVKSLRVFDIVVATMLNVNSTTIHVQMYRTCIHMVYYGM